MIKSMTGYGKSNFSDKNLNLEIEVKTVNSRFLDQNIRMPYQLNFLEDKIIKLLKKYVSRGRVDIFIRSKTKNLSKTNIKVDLDQAEIMHNALTSILNHLNIENKDKIELRDILKNEDVLVYEPEELEQKYLEDILLNELEKVLIQLVDMRKLEGINLYNDIIFNLEKLISYREEILDYVEDIKEEIKSKILQSIDQNLSNINIDNDRIASEIVFYADKQDINEELSRLNSHFKKFKYVIDNEDIIGKKLDFITQEMLRETNTIGSKSSKIEVINIIIEMKTTIEKIKEQVQNIE